MPEPLRVRHRLDQPLPVLDVTPKIADPRVENIAQRVLPQEQCTHDPHALGVLVFGPELTQVRNCVDGFLVFHHIGVKVFKRDIKVTADLHYDLLVLFYERNYGLPIVFGNILRFVLDSLLNGRHFLHNLFLTRLRLILRDSFLLGDPPRLFVVGAGGENNLRHDGLCVKGHDGAILLLLLDDPIEHAIVRLLVLLVRENILDLHLT